jgi:pilus assembly protein Flp/PilA
MLFRQGPQLHQYLTIRTDQGCCHYAGHCREIFHLRSGSQPFVSTFRRNSVSPQSNRRGPMKDYLVALSKDESGATAIEYGLIIALVVLAMIAGMSRFASTTINMWNHVQSASKTAMKN